MPYRVLVKKHSARCVIKPSQNSNRVKNDCLLFSTGNATSSNSLDGRSHYPRVSCNTASLERKALLVHYHLRLCYHYHSKHTIAFPLFHSKACKRQRLIRPGSCPTWTLSVLFAFRILRSMLESKRLNTSVLFAKFEKVKRGVTGCCPSFPGFLV